MARPKKTIRTVFKNIGIPEDLAKMVEVELYSEVEGKVPFGAQQVFFTKLLRDYFEGKCDAAGRNTSTDSTDSTETAANFDIFNGLCGASQGRANG